MYFENSAELKMNPNARVGNSPDDTWTALHYAYIRGNSKIVELFILKSIEQNIDLNTKDYDGMTSCVSFVQHLNTVRYSRNVYTAVY